MLAVTALWFEAWTHSTPATSPTSNSLELTSGQLEHYFTFTFCLLKYALAKTLRCKLQVLSTFWQLYNGIFSFIAIGRQMNAQTHQIFSSYLIFFSCISSSYSASLHSRPSVAFCVLQLRMRSILGSGALLVVPRGGDLLVGQPRGCPDLDAVVLFKEEVH